MHNRRKANKPRVAIVLCAAGKGTRLGLKIPKPYVRVAGKTILNHSLVRLIESYPFCQIVIAVEKGWVRRTQSLVCNEPAVELEVVAGGRTREQSVWNAVQKVRRDIDWVLIHDAARPLVSKKIVRGTIKKAVEFGAAICAIPVSSTVKEADAGKVFVVKTIDRDRLFLAQTPQVFSRKEITDRFCRLGKRAFAVTDDAALFEGTPARAALVAGSVKNIKITTKDDLALFRYYLERETGK